MDAQELLTISTPQRIALNPHFSRWTSHIRSGLADKTMAQALERFAAQGFVADLHELVNYELGADVEIYAAAQRHVARHAKAKASATNLVLVHPFYIFLSGGKALCQTKHKRSQLSTYAHTLTRVLNFAAASRKVQAIVFDTLHCYTALTSTYLERGLLADVGFTGYDDGIAQNEEDLQWLAQKHLFVAGGYNDLCLGDFLTSLEVLGASYTVVSDLVLQGPRYKYIATNPRNIRHDFGTVPKAMQCTSAEFLEQFSR